MSRYDHKIETSLEGIEHLSKEKKEEKERKIGRAHVWTVTQWSRMPSSAWKKKNK